MHQHSYRNLWNEYGVPIWKEKQQWTYPSSNMDDRMCPMLEHGNISGEPWQLLRTIEEALLKDPVTYGFYRTCIKQNREPKKIWQYMKTQGS